MTTSPINDIHPVTHNRSSSSPSFINSERKSSLNEKNTRRYATYDLINNNIMTDDYIVTEDSVQDTNSILPDPIIPTTFTSPSIISPPMSPPISPTNDYDDNNNEGQSSILEGITVTTVKVIRVTNSKESLTKSYTEGRVSRGPEINNKNTQKNFNEKRNEDDITKIKMINYERRFNSLVRTSSTRRSKKRSRFINYKNKKRQIQQEIIMKAPTSNPSYTNDPTDLEEDNFIQNSIIKVFPWIPVTTGPPKLIHASLIPLDQIIQINKKLVTISSDDDDDDVLPKSERRPSQSFRENLLQQSVAMSLNETIMGRNVFIPLKEDVVISNDVPRPTRSKLKRSKSNRISAPKPKSHSQLFRENLLQQSVAMSLNEAIMGRNVFIPLNDEVLVVVEEEEEEASSRTKSKRVSAPKPKRHSQLFRENLLQQSVAMSLNEAIMGRNVFAPPLNLNVDAKLPRRRFSKKGSNAKLEDRAARKERRRKEKADKNKEKWSTKDDINVQKPIIAMAIPRILETDELNLKVKENLRKKASLQPPQPPPRSPTQPAIEMRREMVVRRKRSKRTLSPLPDKRPSKSAKPSNRESDIPFPTHFI